VNRVVSVGGAADSACLDLGKRKFRMINELATSKFDLNDIAPVLKLAATGSKSKTANLLGLDVSTVSRRIAAAEAAVGLKLFVHTGASYALTRAGEVFAEQATKIYDQVNVMLHACHEEADGISGSVGVAAVDMLIDYFLVDQVPDLTEAHPRLKLGLRRSTDIQPLIQGEVDFVLTFSKPAWNPALMMRKVADVALGVYGTLAYAKVDWTAWREMPWISYENTPSHTLETRWLTGLGMRHVSRLSVDNLGAMVRACAAGNGLALLPWTVGEKAGLARLSEVPEAYHEVWLISHQVNNSALRFKVVSDWLLQLLHQSRDQLAGPAAV
jgi:DNA-binding transcriptional LysR family regulator